MTAGRLVSEVSFAEHSREEGVRCRTAGRKWWGHSPFRLCVEELGWPLALPLSCRASQEEETNLWVLTSACSPGCDGESGARSQDVCVQVSRPRSAVDFGECGARIVLSSPVLDRWLHPSSLEAQDHGPFQGSREYLVV